MNLTVPFPKIRISKSETIPVGKSEIRSSKSETTSKSEIQMLKTCWLSVTADEATNRFGFGALIIRICFGFRISGFGFLLGSVI